MLFKDNFLTRFLFSLPIIKIIWYKLAKFILATPIPSPARELRILVLGKPYKTKKNPIPKIIWTYWEGPPTPSGQACQKSWINHSQKYQIIVLNKQNLRQYIPEIPNHFPSVPIQLVSDLIRLTLLEKYGGIWMDYSIILNKPIEDILRPLENNQGDVLAFYNEHPGEYKKNHARPIIENGFIAAKPGDDFIKKWRKYHQEAILSSNWKGYYRNFPNYHELVSNFLTRDQDLIDYLSCYISAQRAMMESFDSKLVLINSEDDYYFYRYTLRSNIRSIRLAHLLLLTPVKLQESLPSLIKLTRGNRSFIDEYIKYRCFIPESILGRYVESRYSKFYRSTDDSNT